MREKRRRDERWDSGEVRRLRKHLGITQAELAQELNTRQQTISEWERGAYRPRGPSARLLTRVAEEAAFYRTAQANNDAHNPATDAAHDERHAP